MSKPQIGIVYRHYKGNRYRVVGFAQHTETSEQLVIYRSADIQTADWWARPVSSWNLPVSQSNEIVPRFEPCKG